MDDNAHSDKFKDTTRAVLRAIAHNGDLDIAYGSASLPGQKPPAGDVISLPSPKDENITRGAADMAAFYKRFHDQEQSRQLSNKISSQGLEIFEYLRCQSLGGKIFTGCGQNISRVFEQRCALLGYDRGESAPDIQLNDALMMSGFYAMSGIDVPPNVTASLERLPALFRDIDWDALAPYLHDQKAFEQRVLDLMPSLGFPADELGDDTQAPQERESEHAGDDQNDQQPDQQPQDDLSQMAGADDAADQGESQETMQTGSVDPDNVRGDGDDTDQHSGDMGTDASPPSYAKGGIHGLYHIYTSQFDETIPAEDLSDPMELSRLRALLDSQTQGHKALISRLAARLQRRIMAQQQRRWQFGLDEGKLDSSRLSRLIANPALPLIFKQEIQSDTRDTVVSLLIDNSGSMRGRPIALAAQSADIIAQTLERCHVRVEILGFTTRAWKGGKSRELWMAQGRPPEPGRLNDLRHIVYKAADTPMRRARRNLGLMLKEGILKENIDGEALAWAYNRLARRAEQRKILMIISDGAPVDDSTLSANSGNILEDDLRHVIGFLENSQTVELCAIGIGHDVTRYYNNAMMLSDAEGLAEGLMKQLAGLFEG